MPMARLTLRIDFGDDRALGPGKVRLLELVHQTGSISAAGRAMGMSYRRAWLLVGALNRTFRLPVVETRGGGVGGGGANLTAFGSGVVEAYRAMERDAHDTLAARLHELDAALATPSEMAGNASAGVVMAVCCSAAHRFSKPTQGRIRLLAGLGVEGDAHLGIMVKHRSRVAQDPTQPNLRQIHLIHGELHDELLATGFSVAPGVMGENVTTRGVDLLGLVRGTRLHLGATAVVEVTGLRNPCKQLDDYQLDLLAAVLDHDKDGKLVRKAGIMGVVLADGEVEPGDEIRVELPPLPHQRLEKV